MPKVSEKAFIASIPAIADGHTYLVVGPYCWGKSPVFKDALRNAKKERVKAYEGKRGWFCCVYDAEPKVYIDDMGYICWATAGAGFDVRPYKEIARFNMPDPDSSGSHRSA